MVTRIETIKYRLVSLNVHSSSYLSTFDRTIVIKLDRLLPCFFLELLGVRTVLKDSFSRLCCSVFCFLSLLYLSENRHRNTQWTKAQNTVALATKHKGPTMYNIAFSYVRGIARFGSSIAQSVFNIRSLTLVMVSITSNKYNTDAGLKTKTPRGTTKKSINTWCNTVKE